MAEKMNAPSSRTLDRDIPELLGFLRPGMAVLDVGCGPGTITLGVAQAVSPGKVIGIDPSEERIGRAREWLAQHPDLKNVSFQVGDSHSMRFDSDTFDLVYSHTVAHFFHDPIRAFKEQARVTKSGGWVIASGVRDNLLAARLPACPAWSQVLQALESLFQLQLERIQASSDPVRDIRKLAEDSPVGIVYYDLGAGRKCPYWLAQAGLENLRVQIKGEHLQYSGSEYMEHSIWDLVNLHEAETDAERQIDIWMETAITEGLLDGETLAQAKDELKAWYANPQAFNYWALTFAAGRA